jgi:hypothetical protein
MKPSFKPCATWRMRLMASGGRMRIDLIAIVAEPVLEFLEHEIFNCSTPFRAPLQRVRAIPFGRSAEERPSAWILFGSGIFVAR